MTSAVRRFRVREWLAMSLWLAPAGGVMAAVVLAEVLVVIDRRWDDALRALPLFDGGPESARTVLSVIAGSLATSISLIFSVTMVVLQLAGGQYSPRVLTVFIRDRLVQAVLAAYIGTFAYCLLVLPTVQEPEGGEEPFVPAVAVTVALALALVSLALFVRYVHHIAHAIRASTIVSEVGRETRSSLEQMYPERIGSEPDEPAHRPPGAPTATVTWPSPPGVLVAVDEEALIAEAVRAGGVVELRRLVGEFIPTDGPLFDVYGHGVDQEVLRACVTVGEERTLHQDAAFGIRQLVDIAEKALSPGINDPTTAVQVLDQLHDILRRLALRRFPSTLRVDEDEHLRVIAPRLGWDEYVRLALDEIRHYGSGSIQVATRIRTLIDDLLAVAPADRHPPLEEQLDLLARSLGRELPDRSDREHALAR
jgi:uncharacterized membrane protein